MGGTLRNLQAVNIPNGSLTWNLCRRGMEFFQKHLYHIPGNGRKILLWEDSIQGHDPLSNNSSLTEIMLWLVNKGLLRFVDISKWDNKGNWVDWHFDLLDWFIPQKKLLLTEVIGKAPIHHSTKDPWGWGKSSK